MDLAQFKDVSPVGPYPTAFQKLHVGLPRGLLGSLFALGKNRSGHRPQRSRYTANRKGKEGEVK